MNNRVRALESLIAIFLLGLIIGVGGALLWVDRGPQNTTTANPRSSGDYRRTPVRLVDLLHLTPEQDAKIKAIYEETRHESAALSKEMGPKFEAIRNKTNTRIAAILNDEQKKIWEEFLKQRDDSRDRSGRGGGRSDDSRQGSGPQSQPNPSGQQESQPPRLGNPQLGPGPSGPDQLQPPGFGGPQQQRRGGAFQSPDPGSSSQPQDKATQKKSQPVS